MTLEGSHYLALYLVLRVYGTRTNRKNAHLIFTVPPLTFQPYGIPVYQNFYQGTRGSTFYEGTSFNRSFLMYRYAVVLCRAALNYSSILNSVKKSYLIIYYSKQFQLLIPSKVCCADAFFRYLHIYSQQLTSIKSNLYPHSASMVFLNRALVAFQTEYVNAIAYCYGFNGTGRIETED